MLAKYFLAHPNAVGETYGAHFRQAAGIGASLIAIGAACFVHALFPALFVSTASNRIRSLAAQIEQRLGTLHPSEDPVKPDVMDYRVPVMVSERTSN